MAPKPKPQSPDDQAYRDRLVAEWANVGLCGGMFRPSNGHRAPADRPSAAPDHDARSDMHEADWHPHNRCCL